MLNQYVEYISREFPEYWELGEILSIAEKAYPLYGLSANVIADMDKLERQMLKIKLGLA
jgi:hypothetical protein